MKNDIKHLNAAVEGRIRMASDPKADASHKAIMALGDALRSLRQAYEKIGIALNTVERAGITEDDALSQLKDKVEDQAGAVLKDLRLFRI